MVVMSVDWTAFLSVGTMDWKVVQMVVMLADVMVWKMAALLVYF